MNELCASGFDLGVARDFCLAGGWRGRLGGWLALLVLALAFGSTAQAGPGLALTWDASPDPGVAHYKIYYGTGSYNYTQTLTVGNVTGATIDGLTEGATYYFAVTAISEWGEESDFSNEAVYVVPRSSPAELQVTPLADGGTRLTGAGEAGRTYQIQASTDSVTWTTFATRSADAGGVFEAYDYSPAAFSVRIYRLQDLGYAALPAAQVQLNVAANKVAHLSATGLAGHAYEIQASSDLSTWTSIGSQTADDKGGFVFDDAAAPNFPTRFYRLKHLGYVVSAAAQLRISTSLDRVVSLNGTGQVGHTYQILASTDLATWAAIGSETADGGGAFGFTDLDAANHPARFYRTLDSQP